jgi:hypothetical protein
LYDPVVTNYLLILEYGFTSLKYFIAAEPHTGYFYAAPTPRKNFDAAPAIRYAIL